MLCLFSTHQFMVITLIALLLVILLFVLYNLGRMAEHTYGDPSYTIPIENAQTLIDRIMEPKLEGHPDESCLMLLQNNLDAFAIRAIMAYEAGRSLDLQYYIWHDDLTGRLLASEVLSAADRGVKVRLLLDDMNVRDGSILPRVFNSHPNIHVRLFNPICIRRNRLMRAAEMLLSLFSINRRMHNKAWIVDGRIAIVGGRNIGDEYFDAATKRNFFDADLFIGGLAVSDAAKIFDNFWNSQFAVPLDAFFSESEEILVARLNEIHATKTSDAAGPYLKKLLETPSVNALFDENWQIYWTKNIYVLSDPPEKIAKHQQNDWLFPKLKPILASAKEKLNLVSPYFVPGRGEMDELFMGYEKALDIHILTNSLAATDVLLVHGGYERYRKQLLLMGVHIYELKPFGKPGRSFLGSNGASLHTKAYLIDDRVGFIGSFNFDRRSAMLNTEMVVLFEAPEITKALQKAFMMHSNPLYSYKLRLKDNKIYWQDVNDDGTFRLWDHEPQTKLWKRCIAKIISYLPIDSQL